jgi:type II secretory pathway component GspD/PulD (secretin)
LFNEHVDLDVRIRAEQENIDAKLLANPRILVLDNETALFDVVTDTETNIKAINTFIEEIDRITPQVLIEVRVYDITSKDRLDLGVEWQAGRNTTIGDDLGSNPTAGKTEPFVLGAFEGGGLFNEHVDLDVRIRAEQENIDAKLLANPRILVLDNETALFDVITEHPYVERTIQQGITTETVKFKEVGVKVEVTPHVTREGMLRLHIMPEFGVKVGDVTIESSDVPIVDTRKLDTKALVKDNQTVVLSGLRKKEVAKQGNKIPLLGDIPLLGALFRFEGEDTVVNELVVFITPRIIKTPALSEDEERAYGITDFAIPEVGLTRAEKKASEE